jgi:hypothetical protein
MVAPRRPIRRGPSKRMVEGRDLRLADEVRHIQKCAARHDGRIVTLGQLIFFSTETGDAWLLDWEDGLAAPLARDGDPEPIHIEETDANGPIADAAARQSRTRTPRNSPFTPARSTTRRF